MKPCVTPMPDDRAATIEVRARASDWGGAEVRRDERAKKMAKAKPMPEQADT